MVDLNKYRASELEKARTKDLLDHLPRGRKSVLDIGARDGHFSKLFLDYFEEVTALDLEKPPFSYPRMTTVAGDVTNLSYVDGAFDCIFCAEVLEHVPNLEKACQEIVRVARHEIVIGVPYKQDLRVGRTTCRACGAKNPPWGHVNSFDEQKLMRLFAGAERVSTSFVGSKKEETNPLSTWLMDLGGNPWGAYSQEEPCLQCGAKLVRPANSRPLGQRMCTFLATQLNRVQLLTSSVTPNWVHMVFSKNKV